MQNSTLQLDVMSELRQQTRPAHMALEEQMPIFQPNFSRHDYVVLLEKFFGIFGPLNSEILKRLQQLPGTSFPTDRTPLLRQDLLALGVAHSDIESLPRCICLPEIVSTAQALGAFYVVEGSMLGGQTISRELRNRFSLTPENGASFFASSGIDVKARWTEDQKILRTHLDSESKLIAAISSANSTFRSFSSWLIGI